MTSSKSSAADRAEVRLGGAQGEIGKALSGSLSEARRAGRIPAHSVAAVLASRMAGVADAAWRASDHRTFMAATARLVPLLRALGLGELSIELPAGGGADDDDDGKRQDALDHELEAIVNSGPEVRHGKASRA